MHNIRYISNFLSRVEGKRQTVGYIPCNVIGGGTANYKGGPNPERYSAMDQSGVTIATGCDLGQTDCATLASYGLADQITQKFKPYLGKKKRDAIDALHAMPLTISEAAAEATDMAVHGGYIKRYTQTAYNRESRVALSDVPAQAQAVIASVTFQYGCAGVRRNMPKLWAYLTTQQWGRAVTELMTGFKRYSGRRRIEGMLLMEII